MEYLTEPKLSREAQNGKIIISLLVEYYSVLRKSLEEWQSIREKIIFISILTLFGLVFILIELFLPISSIGFRSILVIGLVVHYFVFLFLSLVKRRIIERRIKLNALQLEEIIKVVYEVLEHTNQEDFGVKLEMKIRLAEGINALEKANYVRSKVIGNGKSVVISNSLDREVL
ncbi:MAG: hypothetical protein FD167_4494 [bacterium]|nr:MAG: hypothetical protein FD167_4494 [bacterium]